MSDPGKNIIYRFGAVYIFIIFMLIAVIYNIVKIQTVEREKWLALGTKNNRANIIVRPNRGNIYSSDSRLMASSIPTYYVYMDLRVPALQEDDGKLFKSNIDSLSICLSEYFKDKSKAEYKRDLTQAYKQGKGEYAFYKGRITYAQLKDIKKFPLFKLGRNKSGMLTKEMFMRVKPFTTLASRTIGDIYADETKGGKNGLELSFDSILRGSAGVSSRQKVANRWEDIVQVPPVDGMDITTTIDVDMQDIAEKALLDKLKEIEAQTGYAILMEVKTGEIKAIVNMQRNADGTYTENKNGVVSDKVEPGSTFKTVSMMAVLDEGKAKLTDVIATGNGIYRFGTATMKDHNANRGGYGNITFEQSLNASSNVGISKTIVKAYGDNPAAFVDKLYKMKLNEPFNLYIPGSAAPNIRHPNDKSAYWSQSTLPWMSIGYEVQIPPIYTVAFYNSIANNGKYIEPLFIKSISKNGQIIKQFSARTINEHICKPSTLKDVRQALLGVVENPKYGTGKAAHSSYVRIAGKTGTAQISKGSKGYKAGGTSHQVSFCGFFPFEDPRYTCLVVIREPKIGHASGGLMAGVVVKNIAERISAIDTVTYVNTMPVDSNFINIKSPIVKSGKFDAMQTVMSDLKQKYSGKTADWIMTNCDGKSTQISTQNISKQNIPNLSGMGAKDAVFLCERLGLIVNLSGIGKVNSQSLSPGTKAYKGQKIILTFK